jgi:transcription antitermination factor NusG
VPDELITTLRRHVDLVNASNGQETGKYRAGDLVAIHDGPFAGYEAIFDLHLPGRDRVEVLLKLLRGHHIRVELPTDYIALKDEASRSRNGSSDKGR